jgi:peptide/nickel transport system permease protein
MRSAGQLLLALVLLVAAAAPWLAPHAPDRRFPDLLYAPPTPVHLFGGPAPGPYIYPWRLVSRLERRFAEDREQPIQLRWLTGGHLLTAESVSPDGGDTGPLLLLGADAYGRDILTRMLYGARVSLALAAAATLVAMLLGALIGGLAGYAGGWIDEVLSRTSDFVLVLPATYVVLALRAVMPLVLPSGTVFLLLAGIFAIVGWPIVARGVRGIVASEREREYIVAGRALGASPARLVVSHLLPAARGHLLTQGTLLFPAFILAEATLSYVGLGFPDSVPTWGTMLHDATNGSLIADAPWMLAPAGAIFVVVLAVNLVVQAAGRAPVQLEP